MEQGAFAGSSTPVVDGRPPWTVRGLIAAHKWLTVAVAAVLAVMVAVSLVAALGPKAGAVTDATTCAQWGSTTQDQQTAYARRYIREHPLPASAGETPATVIGAINNNCMTAFSEDVDDTTSVARALSGTF
jgi:hypothetical protein